MKRIGMMVGLLALLGFGVSPASAEELPGMENRLERLESLFDRLSEELDTEKQKNQKLEERLHKMDVVVAKSSDQRVKVEALQIALSERFDRFGGYFQNAVAGGGVGEGPAHGGSIMDRTHLGGYFDLEFATNGRGSSDSNFDQHRLIIDIASQINKRVSFYTEIELEGGADQSGTKTITPTVGNSFNNKGSGGEVAVEQVYMDMILGDWITFRGGAFLVPFGQLNQLHDSDIREFTERALPAQLIIPSTWTEAGAGFHGVLTQDELSALPEGAALNYAVYLTNGLRAGDGREDTKAEDFSEVAATIGDMGLRSARGGFRDDNNSDKAVASRVGFAYNPVEAQHLLAHLFGGTTAGVSYYTGALDDAGRVRIEMLGVDVRTTFGDFFEETLCLGEGPHGTARVEMWAEAARAHIRGGNDGAGGIPNGLYGWYTELHYRFMPDFIQNMLPPDMKETAVMMLMARYNVVDLDTGMHSAGDRDRFEFGINFRPYPNVVFKTEYQKNNSKSGNDAQGDQFVASVAVGF